MPESPSVSEWNIVLPLTLGHTETPGMSLMRARPQDDHRRAFEVFVQNRFRHAHGADISHFMPELFGLRTGDDALCAVAGVRRADQAQLFLEHYLDEPIEHYITAVAQQPIARTLIVEVGNLAAVDTGSARLSIITITWLLAVGGLEWVTFTGSKGLVNSFHRLGLRPTTLCEADPERLGEEQHRWGQYYQSRPSVHIGNIRAGFHHLHTAGMFKRLGLPSLDEHDCHVA